MRLLCTGSRHHGHQDRVWQALDDIHSATPLDILIHGDCPDTAGRPRSFDQICNDWAVSRGVPIDAYPADWDNIDAMPCRIKLRNGKPYNALAGFNRNLRMILVAVPHMVVAGWERGPGTEHCIAQALRRDIPVMDLHL